MWKVLKIFWKNLKNCSKITKKSLFFPLFGKKSFLNRTLGLRKSFLNQTTYVLKNRLHQQSFLNQDSFLNQAFLNRDSTVMGALQLFVITRFAFQVISCSAKDCLRNEHFRTNIGNMHYWPVQIWLYQSFRHVKFMLRIW